MQPNLTGARAQICWVGVWCDVVVVIVVSGGVTMIILCVRLAVVLSHTIFFIFIILFVHEDPKQPKQWKKKLQRKNENRVDFVLCLVPCPSPSPSLNVIKVIRTDLLIFSFRLFSIVSFTHRCVRSASPELYILWMKMFSNFFFFFILSHFAFLIFFRKGTKWKLWFWCHHLMVR